jgi:hypothetical protein
MVFLFVAKSFYFVTKIYVNCFPAFIFWLHALRLITHGLGVILFSIVMIYVFAPLLVFFYYRCDIL